MEDIRPRPARETGGGRAKGNPGMGERLEQLWENCRGKWKNGKISSQVGAPGKLGGRQQDDSSASKPGKHWHPRLPGIYKLFKFWSPQFGTRV
ncbi:hypothetical protein HNY73_007412 [Argiope bruennichi]|uniref:Uncharacterized protein n=1 Tax=Argiope bruennichi TaxID=94029 RepID=A0A8T0FIW6_ARGBR|nr:hypothetical protein HNY73_007412 [Argiope bruennichi]